MTSCMKRALNNKRRNKLIQEAQNYVINSHHCATSQCLKTKKRVVVKNVYEHITHLCMISSTLNGIRVNVLDVCGKDSIMLQPSLAGRKLIFTRRGNY